ncbi:MAG: hypothetical protein GX493_09665 [Firmicutes bacterium]|nr:hypothetical protein [Bacillota bacterium]
MKRLLVLFVAMVMVLGLAGAASAADLSLGATLYFRLNDGITSGSKVDFFRISVSTGRSFGNASAYIAVQTQTYTNLPSHETPDGTLPHDPALKAWNIWNYGYDYNFSNGLTAGIMYHTEGVTLSDGRLASDWDWLHVHTFNEKHVLKLTGQPFDGMKAGLYLEPESMDYIIKAEYAASGNLKIGAGYSNAAEFVGQNRTYNVYAELLPFEGAKLYLDYLSDGKFIVDANLVVGPVTVAALYSNEDKTQYGYQVFKAETADISATYAVSPWASVTGGLVYDTSTSEVANVYAKYDFGRGHAGVNQDLVNSETHLFGGYKIDGANTLQGDYNVTTGDWWLAMVIGVW